MTAPRDTESWLPAWLADAAGEPATRDLVERFAVEIRQRPPRSPWMARIHHRWAHGGDPLAQLKGRAGLLAIAAVTLLTLVGLLVQLLPGGSRDRDALGPTLPSQPTSATPSATSRVQPSVRAAEVGAICRSDAPATLLVGPLPITSRPLDLPTNDGLLAVGPVSFSGPPVLLDPVSGTRLGIPVTVDGKPVDFNAHVLAGWSPDGRWLGLGWGGSAGRACSAELLVSPDGTHVVDVVQSSLGDSPLDDAWSPDGRWLAVNMRDRIDVFAIATDGTVSGGRTVWQASSTDWVDVGPAWGPDGTLAFSVRTQTGTIGARVAVALLRGGSSTPELVPVSADILAPLAWTTDGAAIITEGDLGNGDVGMFRITTQGNTRIPLEGLSLLGGRKWLDVPVTIVGDRVVFYAAGGVYTMMVDGSDLTRHPTLAVPPQATLASGPDGRHVAVSTMHGLLDLDVTDGSIRSIPNTTDRGGIMSWQAVP